MTNASPHTKVYRDYKGDVIPHSENDSFATRVGVFAICVCDGALLCALPADREKYWELPGGGVEADEDFATALSREIYEETGVDIPLSIKDKDAFYSHVIHFFVDDRESGPRQYWDYEQHFFALDVSDLKPHVFADERPAPEGGFARWVSLDEARKTPWKYGHEQALIAAKVLDKDK